jgi:hypothetical protein
MKRARFTERQIIGVLKEHEARTRTADLARKRRPDRGTTPLPPPSGGRTFSWRSTSSRR